MLAKDNDKPFSHKDWIYEIKWDGYRAIAEINSYGIRLYSRNGNSFEQHYPVIVEELGKLEIEAIFDGEIVVINENGNPDFQKLQHYDANQHLPILYYVFDLLEYGGKKLYESPLIQRKELLQSLLPDNPVIKFSDHIEEKGEEFFDLAGERNLEGIMAKKKNSLYYPGKRSPDWLKIKHHQSEEVIIAGFTAPRGGRKHFGALVLAVKEGSGLKYAGHTGSGFDDKLLKEIYSKLEPLITDKSPFDEKVKTNMPVKWVEPNYICEVKFTEWTKDGKLRHPIFIRMRYDKPVHSINTISKNQEEETKKTPPKKSTVKKSRSGSADKGKELKLADKQPEEDDKEIAIGRIKVKTTNRNKVFFPDEGITKGDILNYYDQISDVLLPHLKDRPESLYRTPNGIKEKGFFQKDAGADAPAWVKHVPMPSGSSRKKEIDYILCNNKATLLYLANLGCIELNPWHSRVKSPDNPDYMILDIDPSDDNTFDQVVEAAQAVKTVLDQARAFSICKTSGASGLHIYVPLAKDYTYDQVKDFANLICIMASQLVPDITTLERSLKKRSTKKIYLDYLQNRKGQTIASVYSARPKPGATVSTPLHWSEVVKGLTPQQFTIFTVPDRVQKEGDLFAPILDSKNAIDIEKCLQNL